jgi:hypothetical protein
MAVMLLVRKESQQSAGKGNRTKFTGDWPRQDRRKEVVDC